MKRKLIISLIILFIFIIAGLYFWHIASLQSIKDVFPVCTTTEGFRCMDFEIRTSEYPNLRFIIVNELNEPVDFDFNSVVVEVNRVKYSDEIHCETDPVQIENYITFRINCNISNPGFESGDAVKVVLSTSYKEASNPIYHPFTITLTGVTVY